MTLYITDPSMTFGGEPSTHLPMDYAPRRIRTYDPLIKSQLLYQTELAAHNIVESPPDFPPLGRRRVSGDSAGPPRIVAEVAPCLPAGRYQTELRAQE